MHWCMDETLAVLAMIPFIGFIFAKLHAWWHKRSHHKCHEKGCNDEHVVHIPNVVHDEGPEPEEWFMDDWTAVEPEYVEARFGGSMMDDLIGDTYLLQVEERPHDEEFTWFVNEVGYVKCLYKSRLFLYDDSSDNGWEEVMH